MALVVEDGTGLPNADSYQALVDARASALNLGLALPADDTEAEVALRNGARYADRWEPQFSGSRLKDDQALAYPRSNAYRCYGRNTIDISNDAIPQEIIDAQLFAAVEYGKGTNLMPVDDGLSVKLNEVSGAVKQEYFDNGKTGAEITITQAVDAMSSLLCVGGGLTVRTLRV